MISTEDIDRVIGSDVHDVDGDRIGSATEVYLDDRSGNPEWVTVATGPFGTRSTFVPLRDAEMTGDGLRVPVTKAAVADAPRVDAEQHLSPEEEQQLHRHYGVTGRPGQPAGTAGGPRLGADLDDRGTRTAGEARLGDDLDDRGQHAPRSTEDGPRGGDASGPTSDDAMTRSEERLTVGTESTEVGRARLRRHVVTEDVTTTVPVSHEEVRIEREPITGADREAALDGPVLSEEEHGVVLHAERPVVQKETVPVERVRLGTVTVTDRAEVRGQVAHEEIEEEIERVQDGGPGGATR